MNKLLIVSLRAGTGHIKAAEALAAAAKLKYPETEVKNIDFLDYSTFLSNRFYGQTYIDVIKTMPSLYGYLYKKTNTVGKFTTPRLLMDRLSARAFLKLIDQFQPQAVLTTHFIAGALAAHYQTLTGRPYKTFITITDYEVHPLWVAQDKVEKYFVSTPEMETHLKMLGLSEKQIVVSGIPINPKFCLKKDKKKLKTKFNLDRRLPTVLLLAGSFGTTPIAEIIAALPNIKRNFQLIIVCGKNKKLYQQTKKSSLQEKRIKLIYEFVDFIDELMNLSDILITKPGGITVTESLASLLPMIMIDPIPGQEEANVDYFLENGLSVKARNVPALIFKLNKMLTHPEVLTTMKKNMNKISHPTSAFDILKTITQHC